jgi:hypothetical protein
VKFHHAAALALVMLAACGRNVTAIDDSTRRAELAAQRAEAAALTAERASGLATEAVKRTAPAANFTKYSYDPNSARGAAIKAEEVIMRQCAVPGWAFTKNWPTPEYLEYRKRQAEACSGK